MGRKNRMKSTFANDVSTGTFWIRHKEYQVILNQAFIKLVKEDVVIVMGLVSPHNINIIKDVKLVQCYSQKMNCIYTTDLEKFYFNYHKL
jgi:hypothetical protein